MRHDYNHDNDNREDESKTDKRDDRTYYTEVNTKTGDLTCEALGHDWVLSPKGTWRCARCGATG